MSSFTSPPCRSAGTYLQENSYPEQCSSVEALLGVVALGGLPEVDLGGMGLG